MGAGRRRRPIPRWTGAAALCALSLGAGFVYHMPFRYEGHNGRRCRHHLSHPPLTPGFCRWPLSGSSELPQGLRLTATARTEEAPATEEAPSTKRRGRPRKIILTPAASDGGMVKGGDVNAVSTIEGVVEEDSNLITDLIDQSPEERERMQEEQTKAVQDQGIRVGPFGKERSVYDKDYLVHEDLGFCRYLANGIHPNATAAAAAANEREKKGLQPDTGITLQFQDAVLKMPRSAVAKLTRFRGADMNTVKLSSVQDRSAWTRRKNKVKDRVKKQAMGVIELYAKRARMVREPCLPDGPDMEEFCSAFKYTPTADQLRCLEEIEQDMVWRKSPMDRLLCGDVGFGKTEVALRAMYRPSPGWRRGGVANGARQSGRRFPAEKTALLADLPYGFPCPGASEGGIPPLSMSGSGELRPFCFCPSCVVERAGGLRSEQRFWHIDPSRLLARAVRNNHQVALLAPTTILAVQHYRTLRGRMPDSVCVELLRGGNNAAGRHIKERLRNGTTSVVVGTHSLLARKIEFQRLGLLVVDEEQKFGVKQKERLKMLTTGVDVLTLTATPIPRTLHMSLSGMRDLSTIFTPPKGRQNVTTYIMKGTDDIVHRALLREIGRGGQLFYVVPRISDIDLAWRQITQIVPPEKVAVGHSEVKDLEDVVLEFALGKYDVLLATSIIENGIDMPNGWGSALTQDSQMFGLSQLYQLRGRVGRSDVAAFTYLLYPKDRKLSNEAKRRLKAMRELSRLGSGFELANRDLEIRGSGTIFGTDQSGDLNGVGFELYVNMLEEAIIAARGTNISPVVKCDVDMGLGEALRGGVPEGYMKCPEGEREGRVDRLRVCNSFKELLTIAKEWVGEYGPMPLEVKRLFKHTHLHTASRQLGVSSVRTEMLPPEGEPGGTQEVGKWGALRSVVGDPGSRSSERGVEGEGGASRPTS
ncbi:unnamed protein product, partial [Discosporangium mesarthrocarpum]